MVHVAEPAKLILRNPRDVHWRTDDDGYEYIMRTIFTHGEDSLTSAERKVWFTRGWKERLERMRDSHRRAGISDKKFWHPRRKN